MKRKVLIVAAVILATILILAGIKHHLDVKAEYAAEMADLQSMRNAEMDTQMLWKDKIPEKAMEYWYDADNFSLIPASEGRPESFGLGTKVSGHAIAAFESLTGASYSYSENEDYRNKVIHVVINPEHEIEVNWVEAK